MYVRVCVSAYICVCASEYVCTCARVPESVRLYVCVFVYTTIRVYMYAYEGGGE